MGEKLNAAGLTVLLAWQVSCANPSKLETNLQPHLPLANPMPTPEEALALQSQISNTCEIGIVQDESIVVHSLYAQEWFSSTNAHHVELSLEGNFRIHIALDGLHRNLTGDSEDEQIEKILATAERYLTWLEDKGFPLHPDPDGFINIYLSNNAAYAGMSHPKQYDGIQTVSDIEISRITFANDLDLQLTIVHELAHRYLKQYGMPFIDHTGTVEHAHEAYATAMSIIFLQELRINVSGTNDYDRYIQSLDTTRVDSMLRNEYGYWPLFAEIYYGFGRYGPEKFLSLPCVARENWALNPSDFMWRSIKHLAPQEHILSTINSSAEMHAARVALQEWTVLNPNRPWNPGPARTSPPLEAEATQYGYNMDFTPARQVLMEVPADAVGEYKLSVQFPVIAVMITAEGIWIVRDGDVVNIDPNNPVQFLFYLPPEFDPIAFGGEDLVWSNLQRLGIQP